MKRMVHKVLAGVITAALVMSCLPTVAYADTNQKVSTGEGDRQVTELEAAVQSLEEGDVSVSAGKASQLEKAIGKNENASSNVGLSAVPSTMSARSSIVADATLSPSSPSYNEYWGGLNDVNLKISVTKNAFIYLGYAFTREQSMVSSLRDANGNILQMWAPDGGETYGPFMLQPGTYYVNLFGNAGYVTVQCNFFYGNDIGVGNNAVFEKEPNSPEDGQSVADVATPVKLNGWFAGSDAMYPSMADIDYYSFTIKQKTSVRIGFATVKNMLFGVYDANNNIIQNSSTKQSLVAQSHGESCYINCGVMKPGTYYIVAVCPDYGTDPAPYVGRIETAQPVIKASSVKGVYDAYRYRGKAYTPAPSVTVGGTRLVKGTDYTVSYSAGRKNVGTYKVTVRGKGNYTGTVVKTFRVNPKPVSMRSVSGFNNGFTVRWRKSANVTDGYQVRFCRNKDMSTAGYRKVGKNVTSRKFTGWRDKTRYWVQVRVVRTVGGKNYYSAWTSKWSVRTR